MRKKEKKPKSKPPSLGIHHLGGMTEWQFSSVTQSKALASHAFQELGAWCVLQEFEEEGTHPLKAEPKNCCGS